APKSWALTHPEQAALLLTLPFRAFTWSMRPLLSALNGLSHMGLRLFGVQPPNELATTRTPGQLALLGGESGRMGLLDREEHDLLTRALRFEAEGIERLMVPIGRVVTVPPQAGTAEIRRVAARSGHLRLLVSDGGEVAGVLHARDALLEPDRTAGELARPVPRLPSLKQVPEAVAALQEARAHLALVVGADGTVIGMVSLTDLLGQLRDTRARAAWPRAAGRRATDSPACSGHPPITLWPRHSHPLASPVPPRRRRGHPLASTVASGSRPARVAGTAEASTASST